MQAYDAGLDYATESMLTPVHRKAIGQIGTGEKKTKLGQTIHDDKKKVVKGALDEGVKGGVQGGLPGAAAGAVKGAAIGAAKTKTVRVGTFLSLVVAPAVVAITLIGAFLALSSIVPDVMNDKRVKMAMEAKKAVDVGQEAYSRAQNAAATTIDGAEWTISLALDVSTGVAKNVKEPSGSGNSDQGEADGGDPGSAHHANNAGMRIGDTVRVDGRTVRTAARIGTGQAGSVIVDAADTTSVPAEPSDDPSDGPSSEPSDDADDESDRPAYPVDEKEIGKYDLTAAQLSSKTYMAGFFNALVGKYVDSHDTDGNASAGLDAGMTFNAQAIGQVGSTPAEQQQAEATKKLYVDAIESLPLKGIGDKAEEIFDNARQWWLGQDCSTPGSGGAAGLNIGGGLSDDATIPKKAKPWIAQTAKTSKQGIPAAFFAALMAHESSFNPGAHAGDRNGGTWSLFQMNNAVWKSVYGGGFSTDRNHNGTWDIKEPMIAAKYGAKYLDERFARVKKMRKDNPQAAYSKDIPALDALIIAHNAGEGNLLRYPDIPATTKSFLTDMHKKMKAWAGDSAGTTGNGEAAKADNAADTTSSSDSSSNELVWPVGKNAKNSSAYGWRMHPVYHKRIFHAGEDFPVPAGTPVHAMADGNVIYADTRSGVGSFIAIKHTVNGKHVGTGYAHLSKRLVNVGDKVKAGQVIGRSGGAAGAPGAGNSTGPHLHFEVRTDWTSLTGGGTSANTTNPIKFLKSNGAIDGGSAPATTHINQSAGCKAAGATNASGGDSSLTATGFAKRFIAAAKTQLGVPYVWSGGNASGPTGPGRSGGGVGRDGRGPGFDCSGLVIYAAAKASGGKVNPGFSTKQQIHAGTAVPFDEKQPGDIILWTRPGASEPFHVTIYIGNGKIIHAPMTGKNVSITKVSTVAGWYGPDHHPTPTVRRLK